MAFDALQVKALEGLNKFYKYDRPSINWRIINMAWAGKRDWGKTEMTKFITSPTTSIYKGDILFL